MNSVTRLLLASLCLTCLGANAACIDVVDLAVELPPLVRTESGLELAYDYDLQVDQYTLSISGNGVDTERFGPFPLTMACATPQVRWENEQFLITEAGCGTFCWYVQVYALATDNGSPPYERIERPLAFNADANLLAYYLDQDLIRVQNLITGAAQDITTAYQCDSYSGLCFDSVELDGDSLSYRWISPGSGNEGETITAALSQSVLAR